MDFDGFLQNEHFGISKRIKFDGIVVYCWGKIVLWFFDVLHHCIIVIQVVNNNHIHAEKIVKNNELYSYIWEQTGQL